MFDSASVVSPPKLNTGSTSLTELLFPNTIPLYSSGDLVTIVPPAGSEILCSHCHRRVATIIGDCLVVTQRHDSQHHKTVVPLSTLGLMRVS